MVAPQPWYPDPRPQPPVAGVVVTGPNHALHAVLTLLTFWACGGWVWVWLIVALTNRREVRAVDAYGHVITPPAPPRPPRPPREPSALAVWVRAQDTRAVALVAGTAVVLVALVAVLIAVVP